MENTSRKRGKKTGNKAPFLKLVGSEGFVHQEEEEHFVLCPKALLAGMSPEEIQEMKEIYRVAYEKAQKKARRFSEEFSDGGGI